MCQKFTCKLIIICDCHYHNPINSVTDETIWLKVHAVTERLPETTESGDINWNY